MVAEISGAGGSHSVLAQAGAALSSRGADHLRISKTSEPLQMASGGLSPERQSSTTTQIVGAYAQLQSRRELLNGVASVVREVENTAEKAGQLLSEMEENLGAVVKMYPPYPVDSPDRIQLLNNFGGLRKQVEALTFPPEDVINSVARVLDIQSNEVAEKGSESASVASLVKEPMWDIPTLDPMTASDADVGKTLDQVLAMKSVLDKLHASMWKDVINFVGQADTSAAVSGGSEVRSQLAELGEQSLEVRAGNETRNSVNQTGIGRNAIQLVQAVEFS